MGDVALTEENGHAYTFSIVNPEGNRRLGKYRRRWETSVNMCRRDEIEKGVEWTHLVRDRAIADEMVKLRVA